MTSPALDKAAFLVGIVRTEGEADQEFRERIRNYIQYPRAKVLEKALEDYHKDWRFEADVCDDCPIGECQGEGCPITLDNWLDDEDR